MNHSGVGYALVRLRVWQCGTDVVPRVDWRCTDAAMGAGRLKAGFQNLGEFFDVVA